MGKKQKKSWLGNHDLDEVIETTNLDILPKFDLINDGDLETTKHIKLLGLPFSKEIEKDGKELTLTFLEISHKGIKYSLPFNSKALQRSFLSIAIKECSAENPSEIDLSIMLGKKVGIKREQFKAKGFTQSPYKLFRLIK